MSQHLAEPKFPKNKIYQYKCVSDPYRLKQLGGVEEMVMSILSQLTQLAEAGSPKSTKSRRDSSRDIDTQ